jgi:hypothetical protein
MKTQQWSHQLRRPGHEKLHRNFDLHELLAKELGLSRVPKRRKWLVIALGLSAAAGGITIVAPASTEKESTEVFAANAEATHRQDLSDRILENRHIQIAEIAMSGFGRTKGLAVDWNTSPTAMGVIPSPFRLRDWMSSQGSSGFPVNYADEHPRADKWEESTEPGIVAIAPVYAQASAVIPAGVPPEGQFVQEFWRSFAYSKVVDRYIYYLHRYPSGAFADIATARINELREISPKKVNKPEALISEKKAIARSSDTFRPKILAKNGITARKASARSAEIRTPAKIVGAENAEKKVSVSLLEIRSAEKSVRETTTPGKVLVKKSEGRCWSRHIEQCKDRCREGDARACQKLKRLGG